jgi:hypothetical protein
MAFPWSARELVGAARQRDNEGPGGTGNGDAVDRRGEIECQCSATS